MPLEQTLLEIGGWALLLYVVLRDVFMPFINKWLPLKEKKDERQLILRREHDKHLAELEERSVAAQEAIARNLIVVSERMTNLEREYKNHDDRQSALATQQITVLSALQAGMNVLMDRESRTHNIMEQIKINTTIDPQPKE